MRIERSRRETSPIAIYVYAAKTGNNTLKKSVDFLKSDLMKLKDGEITAVCQTIHDAGATNKTALADYGVTPAKLAALQTAIDGYTGKVTEPRSAIVDRKVTKAQIKELFKQADEILVEQMDNLIEDFAEDHLEFVAQYKAARKIIDPKTGKEIKVNMLSFLNSTFAFHITEICSKISKSALHQNRLK